MAFRFCLVVRLWLLYCLLYLFTWFDWFFAVGMYWFTLILFWCLVLHIVMFIVIVWICLFACYLYSWLLTLITVGLRCLVYALIREDWVCAHCVGYLVLLWYVLFVFVSRIHLFWTLMLCCLVCLFGFCFEFVALLCLVYCCYLLDFWLISFLMFGWIFYWWVLYLLFEFCLFLCWVWCLCCYWGA